MGIYIKGNGNQVDTADMADVYLQRALARAQADGNESNITVLQAEITLRAGGDPNAITNE